MLVNASSLSATNIAVRKLDTSSARFLIVNLPESYWCFFKASSRILPNMLPLPSTSTHQKCSRIVSGGKCSSGRRPAYTCEYETVLFQMLLLLTLQRGFKVSALDLFTPVSSGTTITQKSWDWWGRKVAGFRQVDFHIQIFRHSPYTLHPIQPQRPQSCQQDSRKYDF